jgi:hypothetical protein
MGPEGNAETSVTDHHTPRNNAEDGIIQLFFQFLLHFLGRSDTKITRKTLKAVSKLNILEINC